MGGTVSYYLCEPFKICVSVFAFLTGYFYCYNAKKTVGYSVKKITDFYIGYITVFLVLLIPAFLLNVYSFSFPSFFLEFFALKRPNMIFCWYVVFYVTVMMLLPFIKKPLDKCPIFVFLLAFVIPTTLSLFTNTFISDNASLIRQILDNLFWIPSVMSGFLFARFDLFAKFREFLYTKNRFLNIVIDLVIMFTAMMSRRTSVYDFAIAPLFIYGLVDICHQVKHKKIFLPIKIIGKYSMLMWFIHCIFFNVCKEYTQPILYYPHNPILVSIWGIFMCLTASIALKPLIDCIIKFKNKFINI